MVWGVMGESGCGVNFCACRVEKPFCVQSARCPWDPALPQLSGPFVAFCAARRRRGMIAIGTARRCRGKNGTVQGPQEDAKIGSGERE